VKPEPVLFTFHKIREQSEQANSAAWRALLEFYAPTLIRLLEIHAAISRREAFPIVRETLRDLSAQGFERLRASSRQTEREFLGDIRGLLLDKALEVITGNHPAGPPAGAFSRESITKLLDEVPLIHKEMLLFKLGGYADSTIERIMRLPPEWPTKRSNVSPANMSQLVDRTRTAAPGRHPGSRF
jgi:hypothetical protein